MQKPNIYIIGVQKAGTTSLYHYLRKHPEIYGPQIKDYNNSHPFFTDETYFQNHKPYFEKLFAGNNGYKKVITSEVELFEKKEYLERIKKYSPDAKIIVSLRNPLDRIRSMYRFYDQIGKNPKKYSFQEALEKQPEVYLTRSLYHHKMKDVIDVFGKENIKIVFFEALVGEDFKQILPGIYDFLAVSRIDTDFIHENKTGTVKYNSLDKLLKFGQDTKVRTFLVQKVINRVLNADDRYILKRKFLRWNLQKETKKIKPMTIPHDVEELLMEDVKKLSDLLKIDLMKYWQLEQ